MALYGKNLVIRSLSPNDFQEMYKAFNLAFSDYIVPILLSYEQFEKRFLKKLAIDFKLSAGAFDSGRLVGFIFTGIGNYEGMKVAYNGGTGVVPDYRGNKITAQLYGFLFPLLHKNLVDACVLEVLTTNRIALKVYKAIGFYESKYYHSFRRELFEPDTEETEQFKHIVVLNTADWPLFKSFADTSPSFLDSFEVIARNTANEKIIAYSEEDTILGYAIYQPELGRVSQLAVDKRNRKRGIGSALINYISDDSATTALTVMNINSKYKELQFFLSKLGFENQLDQYEMILPLS